MRKIILPGKNFSVNTKKDENPAVIEWLNTQRNLTDSIRFLIEQDIRLHGIRNLQQLIPADRGYGDPGPRPTVRPLEYSKEPVLNTHTSNAAPSPEEDKYVPMTANHDNADDEIAAAAMQIEHDEPFTVPETDTENINSELLTQAEALADEWE